MKTTNAIIFWLILITMLSCTKKSKEIIPDSASSSLTTSTSNPSAQNATSINVCGEKTHNDFMAGQFIKMGDVSVYNTKDTLYIELTSFDSWYIIQTHVYLGSLAAMPQTPTGNPKLGNFPYNTNHGAGIQSFIYQIPMKDIALCFDIVAHAAVVKLDASGTVIQSETAFAKGNPINDKGSWAMYFNYCKQECSCVYTTQSADMFGGQTIPVGTLQITNDEKNLYVTYSTNGWFLNETHLYVGEVTGMPVNNSNTPMPGHFPYKTTHSDGTTSFTYTIPFASLPSCYIVAAHASVSRKENGVVVQTETSWSAGTAFTNTNRWGSYTNYCTQYCN